MDKVRFCRKWNRTFGADVVDLEFATESGEARAVPREGGREVNTQVNIVGLPKKEGGKLTASTIKKGEVQLSPHAGARRRAAWREGCRRVAGCNHKKRDSDCPILGSPLAGGTGTEGPAKEKAPVGGLGNS